MSAVARFGIPAQRAEVEPQHRTGGGVEDQRVAAHLEGPVDLAERPAPAAVCQRRFGQQRGQRDRLVQRRQPQRGRGRAVAGELLTDGGDQLARRAERLVVELAATEEVGAPAVQYLNRLSDWFFVAARVANDGEDVLWVPGANR